MLRKLVVPTLGTTSSEQIGSMRSSKIWARRASTANARAKVVAGAMLDAAVEFGALTVNPVRGSLRVRRPAPDHRLLTESELKAVRAGIAAWLRKERSGPRSSGDIADIIEVMLATGARIGEVLALRWADIDLGARIVEIKATIKTESSVGTFRKTIARPRVVALP